MHSRSVSYPLFFLRFRPPVFKSANISVSSLDNIERQGNTWHPETIHPPLRAGGRPWPAPTATAPAGSRDCCCFSSVCSSPPRSSSRFSRGTWTRASCSVRPRSANCWATRWRTSAARPVRASAACWWTTRSASSASCFPAYWCLSASASSASVRCCSTTRSSRCC